MREEFVHKAFEAIVFAVGEELGAVVGGDDCERVASREVD